MYIFKDSFMVSVCYSDDKEELEELHTENIKDYLLHKYKTDIGDVDIQELDYTEGYAYCSKGLVTFKDNITGMTEYKVWE